MAAGYGLNDQSLDGGQFSRSRYRAGGEGEAGTEKQSYTVLLVEDNPTDAFVIREAVAASGLNVDLHMVSNGQDALTFLDALDAEEGEVGPLLVLLDLNLPKVPGLEVLRALRGNERLRGSRVIVVSSSNAQTDRAAVTKLGVEAYFLKPPDLMAYMELSGVIRQVLGREAS